MAFPEDGLGEEVVHVYLEIFNLEAIEILPLSCINYVGGQINEYCCILVYQIPE